MATGRLGTTNDSAFAYSAAGNLETQTVGASMTVMSYATDSQRLVNRRVDGSVVATYTFDGLGQRIAQGPTSNLTAEVFGYTGTGRLASYATSGGASATYSFDANGQRTRSVVSSGGATTTTDWPYAGLQLLALSASRSDGTTWAITYLYDSGGKPYAGVYRASDEETSTPFLLTTNHRGDVLALTDTAGQRFATWTYDEWGVITTSTTEPAGSIDASLAADVASRQPLRYAGYCYDTETDMYYCSARTYDPLTRQFLSKDPAKADGEESAYQYCRGNPVEKVDPSGMYADWGGGVPSSPLSRVHPRRPPPHKWGRWRLRHCEVTCRAYVSALQMGHPDMLAAAGYGVAALYTGYYGIAAVGGLLLKVYGENLATMPATLQETQVNVAIDLTWTHTRRRYRYNGYGHKTGESQRDIRSASHPITRLFHWDTIASATSASDWERVAYRRAKEAFQRHKAADLRNYGSRAKGADWAWKVRNKY